MPPVQGACFGLRPRHSPLVRPGRPRPIPRSGAPAWWLAFLGYHAPRATSGSRSTLVFRRQTAPGGGLSSISMESTGLIFSMRTSTVHGRSLSRASCPRGSPRFPIASTFPRTVSLLPCFSLVKRAGLATWSLRLRVLATPGSRDHGRPRTARRQGGRVTPSTGWAPGGGPHERGQALASKAVTELGRESLWGERHGESRSRVRGRNSKIRRARPRRDRRREPRRIRATSHEKSLILTDGVDPQTRGRGGC